MQHLHVVLLAVGRRLGRLIRSFIEVDGEICAELCSTDFTVQTLAMEVAAAHDEALVSHRDAPFAADTLGDNLLVEVEFTVEFVVSLAHVHVRRLHGGLRQA